MKKNNHVSKALFISTLLLISIGSFVWATSDNHTNTDVITKLDALFGYERSTEPSPPPATPAPQLSPQSGRYFVMHQKGDYREINQGDYTAFQQETDKKGYVAGRLNSGQRVNNRMLFTTTGTGENQQTVVKHGTQTLVVPASAGDTIPRQDMTKDQFSALSGASNNGVVPKTAKIESSNGRTVVTADKTRVTVTPGNQVVTQLSQNDKHTGWEEMRVERDGIETTYVCGANECQSNDDFTPKSGQKYTAESKQNNFVTAIIESDGSQITTTKFINIQVPDFANLDNEGEPITRHVPAVTSINIATAENSEGETQPIDPPLIPRTGFFGTYYEVYDEELKSYKEVDFSDTCTQSDTTHCGRGDMNNDQIKAVQSQTITAIHRNRWNYFGNILGHWQSILSNKYARSASFFVDDPNPIIELDETMAQLLGGIDGWTSLICQTEMTDAISEGYAFGTSMDAAYAHVQGERVVLTFFNETPAIVNNMYKVSAKVSPGSESMGCKIRFSLYLKDSSGGRLYLSKNNESELVTSQSEITTEIEAGDSSIQYTGGNLLFFEHDREFTQACIRFHSLNPAYRAGKSCLIGIREGDEICNLISDNGAVRAQSTREACGSGANSFMPNCW